MMFKVGDKVLVKKSKSRCSCICDNQIRKIIKVNTPDYQSGVLDCGHYGGVWLSELTFIKKELNNEVDFLDAFQENFKEGF